MSLGEIVRRLGGVVLARFVQRRLRRFALGTRRGRRLLRSTLRSRLRSRLLVLGTLGTLGSETEGCGEARDGWETRCGVTRVGDDVRRPFARRDNRRDATFDVGGVLVGVGPGNLVEERGESVTALGRDGIRGGAARVRVHGGRRGQPAEHAAVAGAVVGAVGSVVVAVVRTIRGRARFVGAVVVIVVVIVGAVVVIVVVIVGSVVVIVVVIVGSVVGTVVVIVGSVVVAGRIVGTMMMMTASAAASARGPAAVVVVMRRGAGGARRADEADGDKTEGEVLPA